MSAALADATPPRRVVICGGGVVGACTAYFLSTHAASPTVPTLIEKCAPACAASGKVGGFLALVWCDSTPALSRLARASFALHRHPRRRRRLRLPPRPQALRPAAHAPRARPRLAATAAPALGRPLRVRRAAEGARDPRHHRAGPPGPLHQGRPRRVGRRGRHRRGGARRGPGRPRRRRRGEGARRRGGRRRRGARAWPLVRPPRGRQRGVRRVRAQGAQHRAPAARAREDHAALPLPQLPAGARRQDARPRGVPAAHWGGVHTWDEQGREPTR